MVSKLTRRAALGTIVAALAVGPFVIRALRRQVDLGPDSFLAGLRSRFEPALSFPRKFNIDDYDYWTGASLSGTPEKDIQDIHRKTLERFYALPRDVRDTIITTQRRYWHNFAQIDEIEFDCTNFFYNKDGTKVKTRVCFEGHVRLKYGYGLMIDGKDAEGKPILWVFNLDGEISAIASKCNLSSMMLNFFGASEALPAMALVYDHVYSTDAELSNNSYLEDAGDRYTVLSPDGHLYNKAFPPHIVGKRFYKKYYNNRTGMPDLIHSRYFPENLGDDNVFRGLHPKTYLNPKYEDPSVPLPPLDETIEYWKNAEIEKGIFLPVEYACVEGQRGLLRKATYSDIHVKRT
jgi:hypothetical protein